MKRYSDEIHGFQLTSVLQKRALVKKLPKRARTRRRLLAAAAHAMERHGYENFTIDDVVGQADVARGTFYLYYSDKSDVAVAVTRAFAAMIRKYRPRGGRQLPAEESIYRVNLFYVRCWALNARLLAGRESLMHDRPELVRRRDRINARWAQAVLRDYRHRAGMAARLETNPNACLACRAILAMADEFLREIYVYRSPSLVQLAGSDEQVADVLTLIWYRALWGRDSRRIPGFQLSCSNRGQQKVDNGLL